MGDAQQPFGGTLGPVPLVAFGALHCALTPRNEDDLHKIVCTLWGADQFSSN